MNYVANAGQILIEFALGALIALVVLRVLLQIVRANFYNPICQFLYKITNPVLMPLRKVIPAWRNVDLAGIALAWALSFIKIWLLYLTLGHSLGIAGLAIMATADLLGFVLMLYLGLILVRVILSFVNTDSAHPLVPLIFQLTTPILRPISRVVPTLGGLDFSPMVAWLLVLLARALIVQPLLDFGAHIGQLG